MPGGDRLQPWLVQVVKAGARLYGPLRASVEIVPRLRAQVADWSESEARRPFRPQSSENSMPRSLTAGG